MTRPSGASHPFASAFSLRAHPLSGRNSFVEYNSRYDAEDAVRKLHDTELNGAKVSVVEDVRSAFLSSDAAFKADSLAPTVRLARRRARQWTRPRLWPRP